MLCKAVCNVIIIIVSLATRSDHFSFSFTFNFAFNPPDLYTRGYKNNNNNILRLIMVKTNRSTSHMIYNIQQSAT